MENVRSKASEPRFHVSVIFSYVIFSWILWVTAGSEPPNCHPVGPNCRPDVCTWTMQSGTMYCSCPSSDQGTRCKASIYIKGYFNKYHVNCSLIDKKLQCFCDRGYQWSDADINECERGLCPQTATCTNSNGSFSCVCGAGYSQSVIGNKIVCQDVNECARGAFACPDHSTCYNSAGSYGCKCSPGYTRRGATMCQECEKYKFGEACSKTCSDKCAKNTCDKTDGRCTDGCIPGYRGRRCEIDIDECRERPNACPRSAICRNTPGTYHCNCQLGSVMVTRSGRKGCVAQLATTPVAHSARFKMTPQMITSEMPTSQINVTTGSPEQPLLRSSTRYPGKQQSSTIYWIIAGAGGGVFVLLVFLVIVVCVVRRSKKSKVTERKTETNPQGTDYFRQLKSSSKPNAINDELPSMPFSDFDSFDETSAVANEMQVFATIGKTNKMAAAASPNRRSNAYVNVSIVDEVPQLTVHLPSGDEYAAPVPIGSRTSPFLERNIYDTTK